MTPIDQRLYALAAESEADARDTLRQCADVTREMLAALRRANTNIADLCATVQVISKNPKKVRADDYAEEVRAAIAKAEGRE